MTSSYLFVALAFGVWRFSGSVDMATVGCLPTVSISG